MKKILTAAVALAVCYRLRPIKAYAWSGTTHEDIVKKSLALLEKEKKQKQVTFYKDYHSEILKGCTQPDEENDMLDMMRCGGERVKEENLGAVLDWYSAQR